MSKAEANLAKIEFIESYVKIGSSDYQWNDNHGELIRCKDCINYGNNGCRLKRMAYQTAPDWYCADGVKKDG